MSTGTVEGNMKLYNKLNIECLWLYNQRKNRILRRWTNSHVYFRIMQNNQHTEVGINKPYYTVESKTDTLKISCPLQLTFMNHLK